MENDNIILADTAFTDDEKLKIAVAFAYLAALVAGLIVLQEQKKIINID